MRSVHLKLNGETSGPRLPDAAMDLVFDVDQWGRISWAYDEGKPPKGY
jgi:hypothetical protein